jgi:hypothetical protein
MLTMEQAREKRQGITLSGDRNQCSECGELFNSSAAFVKHRTGHIGVLEGPDQRRCLSLPEMRLSGMMKNSAGFWVRALMTDEEKARAYAGSNAEINSGPSPSDPEASGSTSQVVAQP